jgi:hypothetical protein
LQTQLVLVKRQILEADRRILAWHRSNELSRRLEAIPGVGPLISVRRSRLAELLGSDSLDLAIQQGTPNHEAKAVVTLTVRARLQLVGREMKMLVENSDDQTKADPGLLRIVVRAHDYRACR